MKKQADEAVTSTSEAGNAAEKPAETKQNDASQQTTGPASAPETKPDNGDQQSSTQEEGDANSEDQGKNQPEAEEETKPGDVFEKPAGNTTLKQQAREIAKTTNQKLETSGSNGYDRAAQKAYGQSLKGE